jgi:hypothetical protein
MPRKKRAQLAKNLGYYAIKKVNARISRSSKPLKNYRALTNATTAPNPIMRSLLNVFILFLSHHLSQTMTSHPILMTVNPPIPIPHN